MRILFVTPPPYLPNRLHRIRSFDLIRVLAKTNEVHLLAVISEKEVPAEFLEIKRLCKTVTIIKIGKIKAYLNCLRYFYLPLEVAYCRFPKVNRKVSLLIKKYPMDLIYLKRLRSTIYFSDSNIPVIIDTTDAMSLFYRRMAKQAGFLKNFYYLWEALKYQVYESKIANKFQNWVVCSKVDKKYLESRGIHSSVLPNAVDTSYYKTITGSKDCRLIFRGLMDKPVNISAIKFFVESVWPKILRSFPGIELHIVGPNPVAEINSLTKNKNIVVTGYVSDLREYFKPGDISICPVLVGTGTRYKILQSWAMGIPVVSTTLGAEGLEINDNLEVADDPKGFARKVIRLIKNNQRYLLLAKRGRKTVERYYSLATISQQLEIIINNVVKNNSGT